MKATKFSEWLFDKEINKDIERINVHQEPNKEYHITINNKNIVILTPLEEGRTKTSIDIKIDKQDLGFSSYVVAQLLLKFSLEPNNISIRKECDFTREEFLEEIIQREPDINLEDEDWESFEERKRIEELIDKYL